jgi:hypothetical protein
LLLERSIHRLAPETLLINPSGSLPPDAACLLTLVTEAGPALVLFQTAPEGPPFEVTYDRRDSNRPLPFPDDYFLDEDPTTATGLRPNVLVPDHDIGVNGLLGMMASVAADADGWSPIGSLVVELSAAPDPATLPLTQEASLDPLASAGLFDLTPGSASYGERVPFATIARRDRHRRPPCAGSLSGDPARASGARLVLTNRVLSQAGAARSAFAEVLGEGSGAIPRRSRPAAARRGGRGSSEAQAGCRSP